ncbi:TPA: helix-turn-helix domain-containing protein [Bacillus thuringiensis]|nr:helix-turn-helix domain-containing protein [Bacillus thuringiensis]
MRSLLNNNLRRQLQFLELLYEQDGWHTLGVCSQRLNCSERILREDIKLINQEFQPFQIDTSIKGIMLTYPSQYSIDFIYQKVLSVSPEFSFIERIFFDERYDIETIAEQLFLSVSTLRRIITKWNVYLAQYEIYISTNPCKIMGNEQNIRSIMVHYFYEKYGVTHTPFEDNQIQVLDQLFLYVTQTNQIKLNFPDLIRIRYWTMVNVIRLQHQHMKTISVNFSNPLDVSIFENSSFCQLFRDTFSLDFNHETAYQLFSVFFNHQYAFTYEQLEIMVQQKLNDAWKIVPEILRLLHRLSDKLQVPLQNEQKIILELYNLQTMNYGRSFILHDKRRFFSEQHSHEFSYFVLLLKEELTHFHFHEKFKWNANFFTETLYILIIHWTNLLQALKQKVSVLHVGIFCDSDIEHTLFIHNIMQYQFEHLIQLSMIDVLHLSSFKQVSKNYDLIITNISGFTDIPIPVVCVNTIPLLQDLNKVQKVIFTLIHEKLSKEFDV